MAPVLNYYKQLCDRYLEIILQITDIVREEVLIINPVPGFNICLIKNLYFIILFLFNYFVDIKGTEKGQIVKGCNTFIYKLTGASLVWNSVGIAFSLDKYVLKY